MFPQFKLVNPYNIIGMLISHLQTIDSRFFMEASIRDASEADAACEKAVDDFLSQHAQLLEVRRVLADGISKDVVDDVLGWEHYGETMYVFTLLQRLDRLYRWESIVKSSPITALEKEGFWSLNDNAEETGIFIIPRVPAISDATDPTEDTGEQAWDPDKRWVTEWSKGINQELHNIYYVDEKDLEVRGDKYVIRNIIMNNLVLDNKKYIKIAASPLLRDAKLKVCYDYEKIPGGKQQLFSVNGFENPERIHERLRAAFLQACRESVDILVFPEMLGDAQLLSPDEEYSRMFDAFAQEAEDEGLPTPFLIIGPTWWHDYSNEAHVFTNVSGRVCVQQKQFSFNDSSKPGNPREDLRDPCREVEVIHIPKLGRLTISICKDLLTDDYRDLLMRTLRSTICICPSFSPGKTKFDLQAPRDRGYGCYVLWMNTCSAYKENEPIPAYIGLISSPVPGHSEQYFVPRCYGRCGGDSNVCLFTVKLSLDRNEPSAVVNGHIFREAALA